MSRAVGDTILMNRMAEITGKSLPSFSLPSPSDTLLSPIVITTKAQSPSQVFSSSSYLNTEIRVESNHLSPTEAPTTESWQISLFLMFVLGYYMFVIYRFTPILSSIFRVGFSLKKTLTLYEIQNNEHSVLAYHSKIFTVILMGMFTYNLIPLTISVQPLILIGIIMGSITVMQLYKWLVIKLCGAMSESGDFFTYLSQVRSHTFILTSIIGIPIAIVASIYPGDNYAVILPLLLLWVYAIVRILTLFINSGFGVLRWILYLCTVELLPVSYLVAIAQRL